MVQHLKFSLKSKPASFWKRVIAYLVDMLIINFILVSPFKNSLPQISSLNFFKSLEVTADLAVVSLAITFITLLYFVILELKIQQTIGKLLLSIKVSNQLKQELTLGQIILRNLTKPFPIVLAIDTLYMLFKRTNQRLLEKFSATEVIEEVNIIK